MKQQTIVERMKPRYPALTQPIVSAVVRGKAGIQWTNAFRRDAEKQGISVKRDKDGRNYRNPYKCRLTDEEAAEFERFLQGTGNTIQETLHDLIVTYCIGGA